MKRYLHAVLVCFLEPWRSFNGKWKVLCLIPSHPQFYSWKQPLFNIFSCFFHVSKVTAVDFDFGSFASCALLSFHSDQLLSGGRLSKSQRKPDGQLAWNAAVGGCMLPAGCNKGSLELSKPGPWTHHIALILKLILIIKWTLYCITLWAVVETLPLINVHINCAIFLKSNI